MLRYSHYLVKFRFSVFVTIPCICVSLTGLAEASFVSIDEIGLAGTNFLRDMDAVCEWIRTGNYISDTQQARLSNYFRASYDIERELANMYVDHAEPNELFRLGLASEMFGDCEKAAYYYERAYEADTNMINALQLATLAAMQDDDSGRAEELLTECSKALPRARLAVIMNSYDHMCKSKSMRDAESGRTYDRRIVERTEKVIQEAEGPTKALLSLYIADALANMEMYREASAYLDQLIEVGVQDLDLAYLLLWMSCKHDRPDLGVAGGRMLLEIGITNAHCCVSYANALRKSGKTEQCLKTLRLAVRVAPTNIAVNAILCEFLCSQGRQAEFVECLAKHAISDFVGATNMYVNEIGTEGLTQFIERVSGAAASDSDGLRPGVEN